jgi:predicted site-specific integrase-resolvase
MIENNAAQCPEPPPRKLYSDKEASSELRISQITLWRERKAGNITYRRLAGRIFYAQADIDQYLERNKFAACAA